MSLLIMLSSVLLIGGSMSAIYFALVRPVFLFRVRRSAVAIRDDLQLAILRKEIGDHEVTVKTVMEKLEALTNGCEHVGIATVFLVIRRDTALKLEAARDAELEQMASAEMKEIIQRANNLLIASLVLNSPFFWFFIPPLYVLGSITGKISRWVNSVSLAVQNGSRRDGHDGFVHA